METSTTKWELFTWGANSYGQLGLDHAEDQAQPQCVDVGHKAKTLHAITGGGGHTALITDSGELLLCGQNHKGQLGLGHLSAVMTFQLCLLPGYRAVQQVSCGWDFTIILTDAGHALACGSNRFGQLGVSLDIEYTAEPLIIESLREPVISVSAGLRHALAVTDSGGVYQWGIGLSSQAKRALKFQPVPAHLTSKQPTLVMGHSEISAQMVTAGFAHCACLTGSGDVFLWGSNKHNQLCSKQPFLPLPTALERSLFDGERVSALYSGWTHLIAQTESGRVFTWGRADYGQLGSTGPSQDSPDKESNSSGSSVPVKSLPLEVRSLNGATKIACGSEHSLAIVGDRVFSWGWNEHGMCGDGSFCDITQPLPVPTLQNTKPLLIGCGAGHSMALCYEEVGSIRNLQKDCSLQL